MTPAMTGTTFTIAAGTVLGACHLRILRTVLADIVKVGKTVSFRILTRRFRNEELPKMAPVRSHGTQVDSRVNRGLWM